MKKILGRTVKILLLSVFLSSILIFSACTDSATDVPESDSVTLKLFSNLPDRKNGQGLIEQMVIDSYMSEHPGVKIEVESLDEEAYKTKFKAYAMDGMPDIVSIWGQPAFLDEIIDAGLLMELSPDDYTDYNFKEGAFEGFSKNGHLYGLPRNTDMIAFYYNKKIFEENDIALPKTLDDFARVCERLNSLEIIPIAMDGMDGWPLVEYYDNLLFRVAGKGREELISNAIKNADFSDGRFYTALNMLKKDVNRGFFQPDFAYSDYGTAMSLFTGGNAAMYYMGSWEASMAVNDALGPVFRENIGVFSMPSHSGRPYSSKDAMVWFGGGYALSASTDYPEEAKDFLNYMFKPEHLSKFGWENGVGMSAQDQSDFMTGNETSLQKAWLRILNEADTISNTPINDMGSSEFKNVMESNITRVALGELSADEFFKTLEEACR
ncbi:MAG: extracellular solute-binding protein [Lachnospiraceae bacterium]|nr:extracellular solute-binding protein [Lachnospiraceae bacterium]